MPLAQRLALIGITWTADAWPHKPSPHLPCKPMGEYMPLEVSQKYDMRKHNGTWYEVSFRDWYPWGPICFCQQSIKYVNYEKGYIDDYFVFSCGMGHPVKGQDYISPQRENVTNATTGERHQNGIYDMYVADSAFKFITNYEWNAIVIGFEDDGEEQYKWVIEYNCGTRPGLPKHLCDLNGKASDGNCYYTGVQMYVRDLDFIEEGRAIMHNYLRSLGKNISYVMDDFSGGTFPPYFVNNSYDDKCSYPCKHGVFNETTKMWGCPMSGSGLDLKVASPFGLTEEEVVV